MCFFKFCCYTQEFLDVLGTTLRLHSALGAIRSNQTSLLDNRLYNILELAIYAAALAHDVHKVSQTIAHLCGEQAGFSTAKLARLEERAAILARKHLELLDRGGANTAAGGINDALNAHLVGRVHNHLEIGHNVANLGAVKEARTAHNLIGHTCTQEHIFENARLGIGAIKNCNVVVARARIVQLVNLRGNPATLVALVACLIGLNLFAIALSREQALIFALRVMTHHGVCSREDVPG